MKTKEANETTEGTEGMLGKKPNTEQRFFKNILCALMV